MQQPDYLEIYPSEVAAKKINKHLDKMAEVKPRVYRKTLLRYKKLAYLLLECVTKIVRMLQSEMLLSSGDSEFQELATDFDIEQIDELRDTVDSLGNLVDKQDTKETKKLVGETLALYRSVFSQAAGHDFGYYEVNECAELLNYWIIKRFSGANPNFKYQIKQLPVWATFVVIAYGKAHATGTQIPFAADFKSWCDSLDGDFGNCWALPISIFNMTKVLDPANFTLDAMVIYDILIEGCLYKLLEIRVPIETGYISKLVKEYRPEYAHDVRTRFTRQQELIQIVCLHSTKEVAEDEV